jgi:hypothetical protein
VTRRRSTLLVLFASIFGASTAFGYKSGWRSATESELRTITPARARVVNERIETEFRTASAITDGSGHYVAGVLLITAGYSADGKYSHFFTTQVPLKVGGLALSPGDYVFGWGRGDDALQVKFYEAGTGKFIGTVDAPRTARVGRIESFHIYPPAEKSVVQIGRFAFPYQVE